MLRYTNEAQRSMSNIRRFKTFVKKILSFVYLDREICIDRCDLTYFLVRPEEFHSDVECHLIKEDDIPRLASDLGVRMAESAKSKLGLGYGFAAVENGKIVGYTWFLTQRCRREGEYPFYYEIFPKEKSVYISGSYVVPKKRNRAIARKVLASALNQMKAMGYESAFTTWDKKNLAVRPTLNRFGFKYIGSICYRRIMGISYRDMRNLKQVSRICE